MGMNHSSNISDLDTFYIFRASDTRINIRRGRIILIEMTDRFSVLSNRINYNKSHTHIPEIPKQINSTVELPKWSRNPSLKSFFFMENPGFHSS